jgi:hypothetical protein
MPSVVREGLQHLFRLSLLGLAGYLLYCEELVWGLVVLAGTFPLWEGLRFLVWPLRPNWEGRRWLWPAREWLPVHYHHTTHTFTLVFRNPANVKAPQDVYDRLKHFDDFNGNKNWIARKRSVMRQGVKYVYFDSLGFFGLLSAAINPASIPVRLWSRRWDCLVVADTATGHMLKGQRRWWVRATGSLTLEVCTEAYEHTRNLWNRLGLWLVGSDLQWQIWNLYFQNIQQHYDSVADVRASKDTRPVKGPLPNHPIPVARWPHPPTEVPWLPLPASDYQKEF